MKPRGPILLVALAALGGCFQFDNPYDGPVPSASFQIVVSSGAYGGTYTWSPADRAFEATIGNAIYYLYLHSSGSWCLSTINGDVPANALTRTAPTSSPPALPPTHAASWSPPSMSSIDDGVGGISGSAAPDAAVPYTDFLHVSFSALPAGGMITYQWQRSYSGFITTDIASVGNGSTHQPSYADVGSWFRVIITPLDRTGTVSGAAVTSAPVKVN
jgi:hypothetical protein